MGRKPSEKEVRETVKEYQRGRNEEPDTSRQFSEAGHQAREDAVGTDYEVRPSKS